MRRKLQWRNYKNIRGVWLLSEIRCFLFFCSRQRQYNTSENGVTENFQAKTIQVDCQTSKPTKEIPQLVWWVKVIIDGRKIQRSTGTDDKIKAQEFHDRLNAQMWEQQRLGVKPERCWKDAVIRWLSETSEKATHEEDKRKLLWLHAYLGDKMLNEITLDVIDGIKAAKLKEAAKATTNRYLALVRSILIRARDE